MKAHVSKRYSLRELADKAGIPGRTLRFYIARGLLPGPDKAGRNAEYGEKHLAQLQRIRELQSQGHTLSEIVTLVSTSECQSKSSPVRTEAWRHYEISPDVVLMVRESTAPWRVRKLVNALQRADVNDDQQEEGASRE